MEISLWDPTATVTSGTPTPLESLLLRVTAAQPVLLRKGTTASLCLCASPEPSICRGHSTRAEEIMSQKMNKE